MRSNIIDGSKIGPSCLQVALSLRLYDPADLLVLKYQWQTRIYIKSVDRGREDSGGST